MPLFFLYYPAELWYNAREKNVPVRIWKHMSNKKKRGAAALWIIAFVIAAVAFFAVVFTDYLVYISAGLDALLYTITADTHGTNPEVIRAGARFILTRVLAQAGVLMLIIGAVHVCFRLWKRTGKAEKARVIIRRVASCVLLAAQILYIPYCGAKYINRNLGVSEYLRHRREKTAVYEEYFVLPSLARVKAPEKGKNLIFVWLESMETTYADNDNGGVQQTNLIPRLTSAAKNNLCFAGEENPLSGLESIDYSRWTFGALFSALEDEGGGQENRRLDRAFRQRGVIAEGRHLGLRVKRLPVQMRPPEVSRHSCLPLLQVILNCLERKIRPASAHDPGIMAIADDTATSLPEPDGGSRHLPRGA